MSSIRGKLIVWLWGLLSIIVFAIAAWNIYNTQRQLVNFFDTQLIQTNLALTELHQQLLHTPNANTEQLLDSLVNHHPALTKDFPQGLPKFFLSYQLPQIFQIWDKEKQILLYKSQLAPNVPLLESNVDWQVFTTTSADDHLVYIVAEPTDIRNIIIKNISLAQIFPMLCLWVILLVLSWLVIRWCIKPLDRISHAVALRQPDYLEPINDATVPSEIKPMVVQINHLFTRLSAAFAREKRFTADAAHELRTPLAALKIQAQVALEAHNTQDRDNALNKIIQGVDRCTHLIQQLTVLAHIKPDEPLNDITTVDLTELTREIMAELFPYADNKSVEIELIAEKNTPGIRGNRIALGIMLRNIIDNAIRYSDPQTKVAVFLQKKGQRVILRVEDQGPGIPKELHARVFEQFYRGENKQPMGSGLGLAIVQQIATLHHATIDLSTPNKHPGLCFTVSF
jgi:two-component system sensor histidine kinase QseC